MKLSVITNFPDIKKDEINRVRNRLTDFGLLEGYASTEVKILLSVIELVNYWDHPPPTDKFRWVIEWLRNNILLAIIFILLMAVIFGDNFVTALKTLLEWFGISMK